MKLLGMALIAAGAAIAQAPDVATIMARVGENQERASEAPARVHLSPEATPAHEPRQRKVAREEHREYDVAPGATA